jgi:hypothetical protein
MDKPILCLDFDGVLHAYSKGWHDGTIYDGPVPGAMDFLANAVDHFQVVVYSSRSKDPKGLDAMRAELSWWLIDGLYPNGLDVFDKITFAHEKPAAFLTIDDRALCFDGTFPSVEHLLAFKPWNRKDD